MTWCAVLDVYVQSVAGQWEVADSAYRSVMSRLDPDTRCFMRSAVHLLPLSDATAYRQLPCAVRDSMDATLWWLATPFFADGINLRALEHFARVVRNSLVSDLSLDA
ncbi:hypothetical protein [Gemmatimonas sp.]|uniref:hypothetical protein n=1 Tax=Gemmatimonas sp. TaxID=1962908 RepID=UPI0035662A31